jgi:preprotein translocase subunit SecY
MIIVVGVAIETARQISGRLASQSYQTKAPLKPQEEATSIFGERFE